MKKMLVLIIMLFLIIVPISFAISPLGSFFSKIKSWFSSKDIIQNSPSPIQNTPISTPAKNIYDNPDLMQFVGEISNIPAPTSNLKYITQTSNRFEIKYGDGIYWILNDYSSGKYINCNDGKSMLPTFKCADKIILKKVESRNELRAGDIIRYKSKSEANTYVIHRLIKIDGDKFYTRADNWNGIIKYTNGRIDLSDGWVRFEDIQDKVIGIIYT